VLVEQLGTEPTLALGTFVTTTTDVMRLFAFLGLATIVPG